MTKPGRLALGIGSVLTIAALGFVLYIHLSTAHLGFLTSADAKMLLAAADTAKSQMGIQTKPESKEISRVRIPTYLAESMTQRAVLPRDIGVPGDVVLEVVIEKNGKVLNVRGVSGDPRLLGAAKPAMMKWVFIPYFRDGEAVQFSTEITIQFDGMKHSARLKVESDPLTSR